MQWSAPLWQGDADRRRSNSAAAPAAPDPAAAAKAAAAAAAAGATPQKLAAANAAAAAALRKAAAASASPPAKPAAAPPAPPPPAPQLALMTVGADWVVRIWVEVLMKDLLPLHLTQAANDPFAAPAAAAALSMSQFCLALVVEPPSALVPGLVPPPPPPGGVAAAGFGSVSMGGGLGLGGGVAPVSVRAAWARPTPMTVALHSSARSEVLGGLEATDLHDGLGGSPFGGGGGGGDAAATLLPQGMSRAAVTIASRVQWLVACVAAPAQPVTAGGGGGSAHGACSALRPSLSLAAAACVLRFRG